MEKFIQLGEKFGLEGEKLLEFVRRQLEEEKEEKRRQLENEEKLRLEEEEREERRRREAEERETRRLERELKKIRNGGGTCETEGGC